MEQISREQVEHVRQPDAWALGKQTLYDLCKQYPDHKRDEVIIAKIWLIGRSFSATIERRKSNDQLSNDTFYEKSVVPAIKSSQLDDYLDRLGEYEHINDRSIPDILKAHRYLVSVFNQLTNQNKRSLASKYLHFHFPSLFFIYDSRAYNAIGKLLPHRRVPAVGSVAGYDYDYERFCRLALSLRDEIQQRYGVFLTPQQIDNLLLTESGSG
jgi:hypothetical protein